MNNYNKYFDALKMSKEDILVKYGYKYVKYLDISKLNLEDIAEESREYPDVDLESYVFDPDIMFEFAFDEVNFNNSNNIFAWACGEDSASISEVVEAMTKVVKTSFFPVTPISEYNYDRHMAAAQIWFIESCLYKCKDEILRIVQDTAR